MRTGGEVASDDGRVASEDARVVCEDGGGGGGS